MAQRGPVLPSRRRPAVPPPSTPSGTYVHVVRKGELLGKNKKNTHLNTFKAKILTKLFKSFTSGRPSGGKTVPSRSHAREMLVVLPQKPKQKHAGLRDIKRIFKKGIKKILLFVLVTPSWNTDVAPDAGIKGWRAARPPFPALVSDFGPQKCSDPPPKKIKNSPSIVTPESLR